MLRLLTKIMFVQAAAQRQDHQVAHVWERRDHTEAKLKSKVSIAVLTFLSGEIFVLPDVYFLEHNTFTQSTYYFAVQ